ncbi:protein VTS1 [Drepanopeziza brunnea f. sp. 'multigermtubi' MB_m1]|uniref:Protein VTS1 n=1 Tax=Marssonina brunnea f. sp. multigermtubi (strain MB_m1) TaxID=1072389 RepID=K1Y9H5_MARBU|nr:protein VTS1 [Drepanopeziza brunnea f. sp. 'multigermtubi' MB_m1]EKD21834.1 protein VTS1 [Drepanopeziza brunnea f. sp. 'multigermtubi' MB_m1]
MDHSSEASELALELRELQRWTSMLDESQRMTATLQMMRDATLEQVRVLMQVLREREAELTTRYIPIPDARLCTKGTLIIPIIRVLGEEEKNTDTPGRFSGFSQLLARIDFAEQQQREQYQHHLDSAQQQQQQQQQDRILPLAEPDPLPAVTFDGICIFPPTPDIARVIRDIFFTITRRFFAALSRVPFAAPPLAQLAAQLTLINLTAIPLRAAEGTPPARPRKSLPYPRDDEVDPRWLRKWLHALRLHKYTACLEGLSPSRLLELHDQEEDLIERGICSIGARKKLMAALHEARENKAKA